MCLIGNKEGKIDNDLQKQHGGGRDERKEKKKKLIDHKEDEVFSKEDEIPKNQHYSIFIKNSKLSNKKMKNFKAGQSYIKIKI
ncbi:hypothetical protein P8452_72918 [Trifolium repens]|nr:hypothetical protein P8452_72918 [Trifolium repens]